MEKMEWNRCSNGIANGNCTCETHLRFISKLYYDIVEALFNAAETCIVYKQKLKKFRKFFQGGILSLSKSMQLQGAFTSLG